MNKYILISVFLFFSTFQCLAQKKESNDKLIFYGDFRFRTELDRNSSKTDGTLRDDRDRLRYRLRVGLVYNYNENLEIGGRIRSGNPLNQQSPHITIGNEFQATSFSIDKAYLKYQFNSKLWVWAGKNTMPLWSQNELVWDADVNPEGIAFGNKIKLGKKANLQPVLGYFIANHSKKTFAKDGTLSVIQLKFEHIFTNYKLKYASGLIQANSIPNKPDATDDFNINYLIWNSSVQFSIPKKGFLLGIDYFNNFSDYTDKNEINTIYKNQKMGFVGRVGYTKNKFSLGYYYAYIQKYAVIDYYAQDDWLRWGNANYTRSSNFSGHEVRLKYSITKAFNTILRFYNVKGIKTTGSHLETGVRFRLDLNFKF